MIYHVDWDRRVITPIALYFKRDIPDLPDAEIQQRFHAVVKAIETKLLAPPLDSTPGADFPN
jgi:hypothetical protein